MKPLSFDRPVEPEAPTQHDIKESRKDASANLFDLAPSLLCSLRQVRR